MDFYFHSLNASSLQQYPFASRQVSVAENRSFKTRNSFDSLGPSKQNLRDESNLEKQRDGVTGLERRQDMESSGRRAYYERMNRQKDALPFNYRSSKQSHHENKERVSPKNIRTSKRDGQSKSALVNPRKQYKPRNVNYVMILRPRAHLFAEFSFLLPALKMYVNNFISSEKHVSISFSFFLLALL